MPASPTVVRKWDSAASSVSKRAKSNLSAQYATSSRSVPAAPPIHQSGSGQASAQRTRPRQSRRSAMAAASKRGVKGVVPGKSFTQGPFKAREDFARLLGLPVSAVRVVPMQVGGGFGGKIVLLEPLVALLALRLRRPVRLVLSRSDDVLMGRPAPASTTDVRVGARRDGTLTALEANMVWDNGAASGWHSAVSAMLLSQAYRVPNFRLQGPRGVDQQSPGRRLSRTGRYPGLLRARIGARRAR
jgi:hypothetical protein